jgi:hypothetical protein
MVLPPLTLPLLRREDWKLEIVFPPLQGGTKGGNFPALQEGGKYKGN